MYVCAAIKRGCVSVINQPLVYVMEAILEVLTRSAARDVCTCARGSRVGIDVHVCVCHFPSLNDCDYIRQLVILVLIMKYFVLK